MIYIKSKKGKIDSIRCKHLIVLSEIKIKRNLFKIDFLFFISKNK